MKTVIIITILLALISCNSQFDKDSILGSWAIDDVKFSKVNVVHKLTFTDDDTVTVELLIAGRVNKSYKGSYRIVLDSQFLYTKFGSVAEKIRIAHWDRRNMEFHNLTFNKVERYRKLD